VPIEAGSDAGGYFNFNLLIPIIPANYTGALEFQLKPSLSQEGMTVTLLATFGIPYFSPTLDPTVVSQFTTGAQAYAQQNLGVTIPAKLVSEIVTPRFCCAYAWAPVVCTAESGGDDSRKTGFGNESVHHERSAKPRAGRAQR